MTGATSYCFFGIGVVDWGAGMGMSRVSDTQTLETLWNRVMGADELPRIITLTIQPSEQPYHHY